MSSELNWMLIRDFNSFLVKRNGAFFSTESGNLANIHSYKYSALIGGPVVSLEAVPKGISLKMKRRNALSSAVASAMAPSSIIKRGASPAHRAVRLGRLLQATGFRPDLVRPAQARLCGLLTSTRPAIPKRAGVRKMRSL